MNITGTVLSKRKIIELVKKKYVRDWDDPRLYTLIALRRRGIPPGAILAFVNQLGVTKAKTNVQVSKFEQIVRQFLEVTVPRLMLVLEPLKVIIDDLPDDFVEMVEVPYSKDPSFGVSFPSPRLKQRRLIVSFSHVRFPLQRLCTSRNRISARLILRIISGWHLAKRLVL